MKGYFRLFNITYEVIHRYSEEIQVGGGGFRFLYDIQNVYAKFLEEWKRNRISRIISHFVLCISAGGGRAG